MGNLRHDLMTSGWSMMDCSKWMVPLNEEWPCYRPRFAVYPFAHPAILDFTNEMSRLLHEALPDEYFHLMDAEARLTNGTEMSVLGWHRDGVYLRVLFAIRGAGTTAALSFENNVETPSGYALILTGQQRYWAKNIKDTWHCSPIETIDRRLLLLNYWSSYWS